MLSCSYCFIELINDERMSDEGVGVEENISGDEETFYNLFVIIQEFGVIGEMDDVDVRRISLRDKDERRRCGG